MDTAEEMLQKFAAIRSKKPLDVTSEKNQATLTGAMIGFGGGAFLGYARKQNMLVLGLVGAIVGAVVSRIFTPQ
jgi:hypothetical protein